MKTKIYLLIMFFISLFITNLTNANVDVTNSFGYTYDCTSNGGILHTTFNLGGHHLYKRDYKIDLPGIIEIADKSHITTSKDLNVSISGCNYKINSCNISTYGEWKDTNNDKDFLKLEIETNGIISKNDNFIKISGKNGDDHFLKTTINYTGTSSTIIGDEVSIELNEENIKLDNKIIVYFTNKSYLGKKEFYYDVSDDNKNIILKRKIFKKINTGTIRSSNNSYDTFEAYKGANIGFTLSSDKNIQGPDYTTGLNYWDYTQHYYTTTKIKLYSVDLGCNKEEYSDGETNINIDSFDGTLSGIIEPKFSGPVKINGECQKFNGTCSDSNNGSIKIFSTDKIILNNLKYSQVGEIGGNKIGVDSIEFTLKKRDKLTYLKKKINITKKISVGDFGVLNFNNFEILNGSENLLTKTGNYGIELVLYSGKQVVGTYRFPLTVVPNYEYTKTGDLAITGTPGDKYANNSDYYSFCQKITDSFGNEYNSNLFNDFGISGTGFDIDSTTQDFDGEGLNIYNNTFNNSKLCFDVKSYSPGSKNITFYSKFIKYKLDGNTDGTKQINISQYITFLKPFITSALSITNANKKLEIGPSLNLSLTGIYNKGFSSSPSYSINDFSSNIKLQDNMNHEFKTGPTIISDNFNLNYSFTIDAKTTDGINIAPGIKLDKNPIISYKLGGQDVKYYINTETDPTDDTKLSLTGVKGISGVKVLGTSQTTGKAETTNNIVKFSDLSKSTMRATVKKNASIITKGLKENTLVNGVIYFNGVNKKISEITNLDKIETLIIKNGNLVIDKNIDKEKFGIIVTRSDNSDNTKGNVYITPGVTYIKSIIYADGGIISVASDSDFTSFNTDNIQRTNALDKQLVIKGSILTRNTIGGAVNAGGKYILPGGEKTTIFDNAMIYDLNYLRRGNNGWEGNKLLNNNNFDNVVIIYNSSIQTNPPKGFSN